MKSIEARLNYMASQYASGVVKSLDQVADLQAVVLSWGYIYREAYQSEAISNQDLFRGLTVA